MRKHDRSWAQLNTKSRIAPCAIGVLAKPPVLVRGYKAIKRFCMAVDMYFTTRYNWQLAWNMAGK